MQPHGTNGLCIARASDTLINSLDNYTIFTYYELFGLNKGLAAAARVTTDPKGMTHFSGWKVAVVVKSGVNPGYLLLYQISYKSVQPLQREGVIKIQTHNFSHLLF